MIDIIYASTSGNVELVCETISTILINNSIQNRLHRAEKTSSDIFQNNNLFILATSTWEHGELNPFFNNLHNYIIQNSMQGKLAAFVGLGDTRYEPILFCEGMNILKRSFLDSGGEIIEPDLKINGSPYKELDSLVKEWSIRLSLIIKMKNL